MLDSRRRLLMEKTPSERVRDLMRSDDLDGAHRIAETELARCGDVGNSPEIWGLRVVRADLLRLRGHVEQAAKYIEACEATCPPAKDDYASLARIKMTRGYCLGHLGSFPRAHELLHEAEFIAKNSGQLELICEVYQRQAMILYLQQDYDASDRVFRNILDSSERLGGWYFKGCALWGIGKNLMIQRHYREAVPWLEDSLALFESGGARLLMATAWSELAVCHLGLGDDKKSLKLLEKALEENKRAGTTHNYLVVFANIGNVYLDRGDYLTAIDYYRRALELAREIQDPVSIEKWSYNIRLAYRKLKESVNRMNSTTA